MNAIRQRLPHRRPTVTEKLEGCGGGSLFVSAGIDPNSGAVKEVFFGGTKEGSGLDAIMGDIAVVISVALQHGVPVEALTRSVARVPLAPMRPEDLDGRPIPTVPASPIGATLDWVQELGREMATDSEAAAPAGT